jgi:hypothetical protein
MNKRAALELSINAIVVIVIAMAVLGLGLGFVRGQIKKISETSLEVQEQAKQGILEDLRVGNKKLSFPTDRYSLAKDERKDIAIGVLNTRDGDLSFKINITKFNSTANTFGSVPIETTQSGSFYWDRTTQTLKKGEARVYGILHKAEGSTSDNLYKISLVEVDKTTGAPLMAGTPSAYVGDYDSKTFFVTVG